MGLEYLIGIVVAMVVLAYLVYALSGRRNFSVGSGRIHSTRKRFRVSQV